MMDTSHELDDCCAAKSGELSQLAQHADIKRALVIVLCINFAMFLIEFSAGIASSSTTLMWRSRQAPV